MTDNKHALYRKRAEKHLVEYRVIDATPHILDIVMSVMMHRDGVQRGGSGVEAICNNDLFGITQRGDHEVMKHIRTIVAAYHFAHIQQLEHV